MSYENGTEYNPDRHWDYISTLEQAEPRDTIRELVKDAYPLFLTFLSELFYIEANVIFLNLVHEVSQKEIADNIMHGGLSQMGVSKRVNAGMRKIKTLSKRPEIDRDMVRADLRMLLPGELVEVSQLYYFFKTFVLVAEISGLSTSGVRSKLTKAMEILEAESNIQSDEDLTKLNTKFNLELNENWEVIQMFGHRYNEYFKVLMETYNIGDFNFKGKVITGTELDEERF